MRAAVITALLAAAAVAVSAQTPIPTGYPGQVAYIGIALLPTTPAAFNATAFVETVTAAFKNESSRSALEVVTFCGSTAVGTGSVAAYMATAGCLGADTVASPTQTTVVFTVPQATTAANLTNIDPARAGFAHKGTAYYFAVREARFGDVPTPAPANDDGGDDGNSVSPIGIVVAIVILIALAVGIYLAVRCLRKRRTEEEQAARATTARAMAGHIPHIGEETYGQEMTRPGSVLQSTHSAPAPAALAPPAAASGTASAPTVSFAVNDRYTPAEDPPSRPMAYPTAIPQCAVDTAAAAHRDPLDAVAPVPTAVGDAVATGLQSTSLFEQHQRPAVADHLRRSR